VTEEIEALITELRAANSWSSSILSDESLGWLIAELRSGNPKRVAIAISHAKKVIADYRADRDKGYGM